MNIARHETEHNNDCPICSVTIIQVGEDGEYEIKPEYQDKIVYVDTEKKNIWSVVSIFVLMLTIIEPAEKIRCFNPNQPELRISHTA